MFTVRRATISLTASAYLVLAGSAGVATPPPDEQQESGTPPPELIIARPLHRPNDAPYAYFPALVKAAMEITVSTYGPYGWQPAVADQSAARQAHMIGAGTNVNISFSAWSDMPDNVATTVRTHFRKGIYGYRLLLIRRADAAAFAKVKSLDDLRAFKAGQGLGWPDVQIYRDANMPIMANAQLPRLLPMLMAGRFDYFPLSTVEAHTILGWCGGDCPNIIIEPTLLIQYPFPIFMHVSNNAPRLLNRLEAGMELLVKTGAFETLWRKHHDPLLVGVSLANRLVIKLPNKVIPAYTNLDDPALWVDISKY